MRVGWWFYWILIAAGLVGCTGISDTPRTRGDYRVRLPLIQGEAVAGFTEVTLRDIEDLTEVKGAYAQFLFAPKLHSDGMEGLPARARFIKNPEGVYVPADELTQHMASVYYHFQNLHEMDKKLGLADWVSWPRNVGISFRARHSEDPKRRLDLNNAYHDGESDATLIVPYKAGQLPLALNPGVLAHEHFHALFNRMALRTLLSEKIVARRAGSPLHAFAFGEFFASGLYSYGNYPGYGYEWMKRTSPFLYNSTPNLADDPDFELVFKSVLSRILNEGLADVWGWIYSKDHDFVGRSLRMNPGQRNLRTRTGHQGVASSLEVAHRVQMLHEMRKRSKVHRGFPELYYNYGMQIARSLVPEKMDGMSDEDRIRLARGIVKALPSIVEEFRANRRAPVEPARFVELIQNQVRISK